MRHNKRSILVQILAVSAVLGLLLLIALPALNKERVLRENKTIQDNLRLIASTAQRYFDAAGVIEIYEDDFVGPSRTLYRFPRSVAGENYSTLFPINVGFTELSVTRGDGRIVSYQFYR